MERSLRASVHIAVEKAVLSGWQGTAAGEQQGLCPSVRLGQGFNPTYYHSDDVR